MWPLGSSASRILRQGQGLTRAELGVCFQRLVRRTRQVPDVGYPSLARIAKIVFHLRGRDVGHFHPRP